MIRAMDAADDRDLERMLALYRDACAAAGVEPLPGRGARIGPVDAGVASASLWLH